MAAFIYIKSEPELWTVGHYEPEGKFIPESDHGSEEDAAKRVRFLNGGPVTELPGHGSIPIMSLRDYFAAAAMQGMLSCQDLMNETIKLSASREEARAEVAFCAYAFADYMLAERAKGAST